MIATVYVVCAFLVCGVLARIPTCAELPRGLENVDYNKWNGRWLVQEVLLLGVTTDDNDVRTYQALPDDPITSTMVCHRETWTNVAGTGHGKAARGDGHHETFVRTAKRNLTSEFQAETIITEYGSVKYAVKKNKKQDGVVLDAGEKYAVVLLCTDDQDGTSKPSKIILKVRTILTSEETAPIWQRVAQTLHLDTDTMAHIWRMGTYCF